MAENSYVDLTGYGCVAGGLVGSNEGTITGCKASNSTISTSDPVSNVGVTAGGLVGQIRSGGTITDCVVSGGKVTATATAMNDEAASSGGLIGLIGWSGGTITDCVVSDGKVTATVMNGEAYSGGFVGGVSRSNLSGCVVSDGKVTATAMNGKAYSGGFVGGVAESNLSGNTTTITELPAIGSDERLSPPGPSNDI
ncbi:MAG: hypothetical protein LBE65_00395 [Synergistaceae bacterium]|nr:hypothetical protein [Synergistaceae bacterium]